MSHPVGSYYYSDEHSALYTRSLSRLSAVRPADLAGWIDGDDSGGYGGRCVCHGGFFPPAFTAVAAAAFLFLRRAYAGVRPLAERCIESARTTYAGGDRIFGRSAPDRRRRF